MSTQLYNHFSQVNDRIDGIVPIDYFFAKEMLASLSSGNEEQESLFHLFLALSASLRAGHSCLPLDTVAGQQWGKAFAKQKTTEFNSDNQTGQLMSHCGYLFPALSPLQTLVLNLSIGEENNQLLVFENSRLYLRRYYQFERELGQAISQRLSQASQFDQSKITQCVSRLFPVTSQESELDWQKIAVANAINKNFSVIAGGPGTGKTYTVTKLLAALVMLDVEAKQNNEKSELNIALVAPTGKAAQRLSESIMSAIDGFKDLIDANVLAMIPTQAQTIHRLLGVLSNSPNFKHDEANKLHYDVVLIDEVSMVDLPLMTRVFRALKDDAKVILLGDADQLPSVAAGSVLADIAPRPHNGYSETNIEYLAKVCQFNPKQVEDISSFSQASLKNKPCSDYLTFLLKSRRFDGEGGIGLIANSVINGDVKASWQLLNNAQAQASGQLSLATGEFDNWLKPLVKQYYQPIESCEHITDAFALLTQFRVLCATRQGEYGVEKLNELIKGYLGKGQGLYQQSQQSLYHGQPIMINENDYRLGLYNGDIGIIWKVIDQDGKAHLMACFETSQTDASGKDQIKVRKILPSRLPKFESVYAMTIHKTQGSEFAHVAMAISASQNTAQTASKLLSRELLYTGITRAKKQLTIACNQPIWQQGVTAKVQRYSGLNLYSTAQK